MTQIQSSKKNIHGTHHPLIRVGRKKNSGLMMKAAIQYTKLKRQVSIIKQKHSRYTPSTNQVWEEKEEGRYDDSSCSEPTKKRKTSFNHQRKTFKVHTTDQYGVGGKRRGE